MFIFLYKFLCNNIYGDIMPECNQCGKCCLKTYISLDNIPVDKDEKELAKWLHYHGVRVYNKNGNLAIELPSSCKHLEKLSDGKYNCKIYEQRPVICKEYWCKEMIDREIMMIIKEAQCIIPT
jgi:Fe-S-cluster containining protein